MNLSLDVISSIEELVKIQEAWDNFVIKHSDNPFYLYKFIEMYAKHSLQHCTPRIIVGKVGKEIVGLAPIKTYRRFGMNIATFIMSPENSPDFLTRKNFKEDFINQVVDYLSKTLNCSVMDFTFLTASDSAHFFQKICQIKNIRLIIEPYMGRRVLEIDRSWEQFESLRGSNFRRKFRKMRNKLSMAGSYGVFCVEGAKQNNETFRKILEIEKSSWKEVWRSKHGMKIDPDLAITWSSSVEIAKMIPNFKSIIWFLELNTHLIAYAIVLLYKQNAIIAKTSYDIRYKKYYPGVFLIYLIIQSLFKSGTVKNIDFMTDLKFMENWTKLCLGRVRMMAVKGILPNLIFSVYHKRQFKTILSSLPYYFSRFY